jgi:hypothetical protein
MRNDEETRWPRRRLDGLMMVYALAVSTGMDPVVEPWGFVIPVLSGWRRDKVELGGENRILEYS